MTTMKLSLLLTLLLSASSMLINQPAVQAVPVIQGMAKTNTMTKSTPVPTTAGVSAPTWTVRKRESEDKGERKASKTSKLTLSTAKGDQTKSRTRIESESEDQKKTRTRTQTYTESEDQKKTRTGTQKYTESEEQRKTRTNSASKRPFSSTKVTSKVSTTTSVLSTATVTSRSSSITTTFTSAVVPTTTSTTTISFTTTSSVPIPTQSWTNPSIASGPIAISSWPAVSDQSFFRIDSAQGVVDPVSGNNHVMNVTYPAGSVNPSNNVQGGIGFRVAPSAFTSVKTATLQYDVYFPSNFDFVLGGKLPGLYGGNTASCTGGNSAADCFSTRFMWRQNGAGELYVYCNQAIQDSALFSIPPETILNPEMAISVGRGSFSIKSGEWVNLMQKVQLNTFDPVTNAPKADGSFVVQVNGQSVMSFNKMIWLTDPSYPMRGIDFETFFGGSSSKYATPTDQYSLFRNIRLTGW